MGRKTRQLDSVVSYPRTFDKKTGVTRQPAGEQRWEGTQITESVGHPRTKGKYLEGGPFYSVRIEPNIRTRSASLDYDQSSKVNWTYRGPICVPLVPSSLGGYSVPSQDSAYLDKYGATAIKLVDPTNANAETGVALGEILRDGISLPGISTWKNRTKIAKAAGSEYLSAVFGWLPLVSDINDTAESIRQSNVILDGYRKGVGKGSHEEFQFDDEVTESSTTISSSASAVVAGGSVGVFGLGGAVVTRHTRKVVRRWFSGAFTYGSPSGSSETIGRMLGVNSEIDRLFGLSLSPDLLWELTPWSWAVDWVSNAGDVVHNIGSFGLGGLVMRYGYIMEETSITDTYSMNRAALRGDDGSVPPSVVTYTVKRRREANPFGFGLEWNGLSPSQLAILASLAITRRK